jgi:hypothetical protein
MTAATPAGKKPRAGFAGRRGWVAVALAGWLIPGIMTAAYIVLMFTSEVDASGAAWESIGLAFVLLLWWLFRLLTEHAAMARAVAIGDSERVAELADYQLGKRRSARGRARYLVYRALADELDGDWQAVLARLAQAEPQGPWRWVAASVRVSALVELGRVAEARVTFDAELSRGAGIVRDAQLAILGRLAEARLRRAEGDRAGATELLSSLVRDVRAGSGTRARAQQLLDQLSAGESPAPNSTSPTA